MKVTVVGCSGSLPGPQSPASCYLIEAQCNDDDGHSRTWRVVLDLGNGSLGALQRYVDPTTLDALHDDLTMFPQTLVNVRVQDRAAAVASLQVQRALREAEARLDGRGRVNLRPSGTENLVRVMVEGPDEAEIHEIAAGIAALIR